ncbi:hypothetical protein Tco_0669797 [Tanacetum coccineum]
MSTPDYIYPIIVPSDSNVEDAFSSTNTPHYISASPDYFPASPGNTSPDPSDGLSKFFLPEEILPPQKRACFLSPSSTDFSTLPQVFEIGEGSYKTSLERHEEQIENILNHLDELPLKRIEHMENRLKVREQIRHDDEIVLARVRTFTLGILIEDIQVRSLSKFPYIVQMTYDMILILCCLVNVDRMDPKRTRTSASPAMSQAAIRKLVADSVFAALEAQATTMANADNTNRNTRQGETPVARKCSYKEFMSCQPFNFKGMEGAVSFIRWFKRTESVFSHSNCIDNCKVKFSTGTLTEEALFGGIHIPTY